MLVKVVQRRQPPLGVILGGGCGRRMGGAKALMALGGRPLISYPLAAMSQAVPELVVVVKAATVLPELPGVQILTEPPEPQHPLVGIVYALEHAAGRAVLVCAADMPFVTVAALRELAMIESADAAAVIAVHEGMLQPHLGRYEPSALERLESLARSASLPLRQAVADIAPRAFELSDPGRQLFNVNTPHDLAEAEAMLAGRSPSQT